MNDICIQCEKVHTVHVVRYLHYVYSTVAFDLHIYIYCDIVYNLCVRAHKCKHECMCMYEYIYALLYMLVCMDTELYTGILYII